ncbi:MAG TPA: hypothetical protein VN924_12340, partial [Bryobacteraceae bacterium]|nr:hypothetical protein [Bryobacteraceae bacterium]
MTPATGRAPSAPPLKLYALSTPVTLSLYTTPEFVAPPPWVVPYRLPAESRTTPEAGYHPPLSLKLYGTVS